jgi:hypothetical protein
VKNHVPILRVTQANTIISYARFEGSSGQATAQVQHGLSQANAVAAANAFEIQEFQPRLPVVTIWESQSNQRARAQE